MAYIDIITVDYDNVSYIDLLNSMFEISKHPNVKSIHYRSSAMKGWHVKISLRKSIPSTEELRLRRLWRDDGNRIVIDILRTGCKQVLWDAKCIKGFWFHSSKWILFMKK